MDNFITLTCPTCGGKLQITDDIERFACAHCGNEHIVKRGGGVITLAPVTESLNHIKVGVDKTASELAIKRLKEEIADIEKTRTKEADAVTSALYDPNIFKQVKNSLASRRKSFLDRLNFKADVDELDCLREIRKLTPDEIKHLKENRAIYMICVHIDIMGRCDIAIREKRDQISRHQKIVNSM